MKSTKMWTLLIVLVLALSMVLSACKSGEKVSESDTGDFEYKFMAEYQNLPDQNPTLKDQKVMERFGIKYETNFITLDGGVEKFNVQFASGNYPDVITNLNHEPEVKKWADAGYLVPMSDYLDQLQNYRERWSEEDWKLVMDFAANSDGKLYYLPAQNYRTHSKAWIYRKDIFDKLGLEFPKTLNELYDVIVTLKEAYPNSVPISNRDISGVLGISIHANRLPGDVWGFGGFWRDPDQNNEVHFAAAQDKFREALKFVNKLYEENLIEKEFPTMTEEQWTQRGVNEQSFIMYDYGTRASYFQNLMPKGSSAQWTWAPVAMSAGDRPGFVQRELPFFAYGPVITNKLEGERLNRILEYFNWAASEEGTTFHTLGIEGETFEVVDGKPQYTSGATTKHEHFSKTGFMEFLFTDPDYIQADPDRQTDLEVSKAFADDEYAPFTAYELSQDEQAQANSMITGIKDIAEEFAVKTIMGQIDINDDKVWNSYIENLNQAGLKELLEIYRGAVK
jgi:putative aldouronate transport system substrate-binding protein